MSAAIEITAAILSLQFLCQPMAFWAAFGRFWGGAFGQALIALWGSIWSLLGRPLGRLSRAVRSGNQHDLPMRMAYFQFLKGFAYLGKGIDPGDGNL